MNTEINTFLPNTDLCAISFGGADAAKFLQGQLSADMLKLPPDEWRRAAYCSPKGRALATMIVARRAADIIALVPADVAAQTAAALSKFVMRAKVKISLLSCAIETRILSDSSPPHFVSGGVCERDDALWIDEGGGACLRVCFAATTQTAGDAAWRQMQIRRGIPWIGAATASMFVPQYFNWELLGGVNFQKGCYVGQEIIARLHYLGNIKRRGYIIAGAGAPPLPGDKIGAAEIINAAADGDNYIAFVSAPREMNESQRTQTPPLQTPPYGLPSADKDQKRTQKSAE